MNMTKIRLGILALFITAIAFVSCSKENETTSIDENSIASRLKFLSANDRFFANPIGKSAEGDIIIVQWDEWGRASKNCGGWGLCNAEWFPLEEAPAVDEVPELEGKASKSYLSPKNGGSTILEFDSKVNKYYIDILLAEDVPSDVPSASLTFKIDKDFSLDVKNAIGENLIFHTGIYLFDKSLGNSGGYRIYLD